MSLLGFLIFSFRFCFNSYVLSFPLDRAEFYLVRRQVRVSRLAPHVGGGLDVKMSGFPTGFPPSRE